MANKIYILGYIKYTNIIIRFIFLKIMRKNSMLFNDIIYFINCHNVTSHIINTIKRRRSNSNSNSDSEEQTQDLVKIFFWFRLSRQCQPHFTAHLQPISTTYHVRLDAEDAYYTTFSRSKKYKIFIRSCDAGLSRIQRCWLWM